MDSTYRNAQRGARVAAWQTTALGGGDVALGSSYATAARMLVGAPMTPSSHSA